MLLQQLNGVPFTHDSFDEHSTENTSHTIGTCATFFNSAGFLSAESESDAPHGSHLWATATNDITAFELYTRAKAAARRASFTRKYALNWVEMLKYSA